MDVLTDADKWEAVKNNDHRYDGVFYYGVKTTGIFCRPSCKSKVPRRDNVVYFANPQEALELGFRPCKRCQPEARQQVFESAFQEATDQITAILRHEFSNPDVLKELSRRIGASPAHLQRAYKRITGYTPKEYLRLVRIQKAAQLLRADEMNTAEIGFAVGFKSLSAFYAAFRSVTGLSPGEFKIAGNGGGDHAGL